MFDKYLIVADSLRNIGPKDDPTGFAFDAKLGYYRGLGLSMIEDLSVTVDGEAAARDAVRFDEGPGPLSLDEMAETYDRRWGFGAVATVSVRRAGGLPTGEHTIGFTERLRVSYLPFPSINSNEKTMVVAR